MDHDRWIPLAILGALGALLLFLLRQATREAVGVPRIEQVRERPELAPIPIAMPLATLPEPAVAPATPLASKPRPLARPAPASIDKVLRLLHEEDSLTAAFLLREILAAPASKSAKRAGRRRPSKRQSILSRFSSGG